MSVEAPAFVLEVFAEDTSAIRRFFLSTGRHAIGAGGDAEVRLAEAGISRRHALLEVFPDGGAALADLGSKNGTFVAGQRISAIAITGPVPLAFGPVRAMLYPARPDSAPLGFLGLGAPAAGEARKGTAQAKRGALATGPSTLGQTLGERWLEASREALSRLAAGEIAARAAAAELLGRWVEAGLVERAELLDAAGSIAAVAASRAIDRHASAGFEIVGPDGWRLRLRLVHPALGRQFAPLAEIALDLIAAVERRSGATGAAAEPAAPAAPAALAATGAAGERRASGPPLPVGLGAEMRKLYRLAARVARGGVPVLILGESGSGKEVLARFVHAASLRARGPFLAVNCAALPRELLEAELFGIERGVATGVEARAGLLERASGGTVFLDELGDMAAETQAKVLRVLENTSLFRVGGRQPIQVDVRFVAATNRDLGEMVERGAFRRDLYFRIAAFEGRIPPLRERRDEIPALAIWFLVREAGRLGLAHRGITREALGALVAHAWPGNVRELENEIARAALLLDPGAPLDLGHLSPRVRGAATGGAANLTLAGIIARAELEAFRVALAAAGGDPRAARGLLQLPRSTFYRRLRELGLTAEADEDGEASPATGTTAGKGAPEAPENGSGSRKKSK